jgi:hypothetical protein
MKGGTLALLYILLLELDTTYSKPIKGLDETIHTKLNNVFMNRWSDFHAPVHSAAFAMDRQFCRRDMDAVVKKDIWSVMEDFSKAPGGKDLSKMKAQYEMFAAANGHETVTEQLRGISVRCNVNLQTVHGVTPLHTAGRKWV